jgi:hypothetical protein
LEQHRPPHFGHRRALLFGVVGHGVENRLSIAQPNVANRPLPHPASRMPQGNLHG